MRSNLTSLVLLTLVQLAIGGHGWLASRAQLAAPLGLRVGLLVVREMPDGGWGTVDATTEPPRGGDRLQVEVMVDERCRVRLVSLAPEAGLEQPWFPTGSGERMPVLEPGVRYTLPSPTRWYPAEMLAAEGRLVLVAERPGDAADDGAWRGRIETFGSAPVAERVQVPMPDAGMGYLQLRRAVGQAPLVVAFRDPARRPPRLQKVDRTPDLR